MTEALNSFHPNIKLTIEENPTKFLDASIARSKDGKVTCSVNKVTKITFHLALKILTKYKRSIIKRELSQTRRIGGSLENKLHRILKKYRAEGYPQKFIETQ